MLPVEGRGVRGPSWLEREAPHSLAAGGGANPCGVECKEIADVLLYLVRLSHKAQHLWISLAIFFMLRSYLPFYLLTQGL